MISLSTGKLRNKIGFTSIAKFVFFFNCSNWDNFWKKIVKTSDEFATSLELKRSPYTYRSYKYRQPYMLPRRPSRTAISRTAYSVSALKMGAKTLLKSHWFIKRFLKLQKQSKKMTKNSSRAHWIAWIYASSERFWSSFDYFLLGSYTSPFVDMGPKSFWRRIHSSNDF